MGDSSTRAIHLCWGWPRWVTQVSYPRIQSCDLGRCFALQETTSQASEHDWSWHWLCPELNSALHTLAVMSGMWWGGLCSEVTLSCRIRLEMWVLVHWVCAHEYQCRGSYGNARVTILFLRRKEVIGTCVLFMSWKKGTESSRETWWPRLGLFQRAQLCLWLKTHAGTSAPSLSSCFADLFSHRNTRPSLSPVDRGPSENTGSFSGILLCDRTLVLLGSAIRLALRLLRSEIRTKHFFKLRICYTRWSIAKARAYAVGVLGKPTAPWMSWEPGPYPPQWHV